KLPTALVHLKYVYVDYMCFLDKYGHYGLPFVALLIRSSPNLEKLKLQILNFSNEKEELDFVKLILAKSPVLKKVKLILREEIEKDEELQITRVLLQSPRASPLVKIVVKHGVYNVLFKAE
ncbi:F-box/FBD/LRR-repeat protein-like protein, partial [Tanacetum coccineum]